MPRKLYIIEEKGERRKKTGLSSFFARRKKQKIKYANGIRIGARRLRTISIYIWRLYTMRENEYQQVLDRIVQFRKQMGKTQVDISKDMNLS